MNSQKEQSRVGEQIVDSKLGEESVESVSMSEEKQCRSSLFLANIDTRLPLNWCRSLATFALYRNKRFFIVRMFPFHFLDCERA